LNKSALSHLLASETSEEFNQHWDFIAEHFDLLFQAPEHVAPLRQSILELAVRGKLTRREAGDESAGELLKQIAVEKEELRNEGKISNGEDLEPIKESEIPFQLPNGWEWARLEELCSLIVDIAHQMPKSVDDGVKFISAKDLLDDGTINFERNIKLISEEDFENLAKRVRPQRGDIIYSRIGARLGKARIVNTDEKFMVSYSCCVIRPLLFDLEYLNFYLDSGIVLDQAQGHTKSIGVPDLGMKKIKSFLIAVPPLQEQQRIVARANELKRLCDALEARLQSAEEERGRLVAAVMSTVGG
jgi:type I restriction enzyme S subunit